MILILHKKQQSKPNQWEFFGLTQWSFSVSRMSCSISKSSTFACSKAAS